jgi:hypothetical protein
MKKLAVIVINYRRVELTTGCLEALAPEIAGRGDRCAVVIDNGSDDGSAAELERVIAERGWRSWITLVKSPVNGGFAAGNNLGFAAVAAECYLLLNSDARVRPGALDTLLQIAGEHPQAGLIGPRLEDPEGRPQISCFRFRTPASELLAAAATGPLTRLLQRYVVAERVYQEAVEPPWVSFACVLIRRGVVEQIGPMDEGYFMYFEDIDYARRARAAGWGVRHDPRARVVHLRGGTSSVKAAIAERRRIPRYYFESRSRYFAKFYGGRGGLWATNLLWLLGRCVSLGRELLGRRKPAVCRREWLDNWTNAGFPLREPALPGGGEL